MKVNLHTHTLYCDGKNSPEEMVLDAISAGFDVLGISGHSYTSFDESYCMSREQTAAYEAELRSLAEKYKEQITIYCGLEKDLFADDSAAAFDYAIGSVHAIFREAALPAAEDAAEQIPGGIHPVQSDGSEGRSGYYIYADWTDEAMDWAIRRIYGGDALALAEDYYAHTAQFAQDPEVQIVGHLDLLTKFEEMRRSEGKDPLFDTEHPRYLAAARSAIRALSDAGKIFEINTGAMTKGYRTSPYPSLPLLRIIREAGGRITISSDCHAAGKLDFAFDAAKELAREAGFTQFWVLTPDREWKAVSLD